MRVFEIEVPAVFFEPHGLRPRIARQTALIWAAVYWVIEVKGIRFGSNVLKSAGQNALFAFILGPIVYTLLDISAAAFSGFSLWGWLGSAFISGLARSLIFAAAAVGLTAWMQRRGLGLRI